MDKKQTIEEHLKELKKCFLKVVVPLIIIFFVSFAFSSSIILNLLKHYSITNAYALDPFESINSQIFISFTIAIISLIPLIAYSFYMFIKPAFTVKNIIKKIIYSYVLGIIGFFLGVLVISKLILKAMIERMIVPMMLSLKSILNLSINIGIATAMSLQLIIIIPILHKLGLINIKQIRKKRFFLIPILLLIAGIITPDGTIINQIVMAVPIYGSLELGMLFCKDKKIIMEDTKC